MRRRVPVVVEAMEFFLDNGDLHIEKKRHILSMIIEIKEEYVSASRDDNSLDFIDIETRKEIKRQRKLLRKMR